MANLKQVSVATWESEVGASSEPVLVDFTATWCPPCKALAPILEETAAEFAGRLKVVKVDIDEDPQLAQQYGVMSIPNLVFLVGGDIVNQHTGFIAKPALAKLVNEVLA